MNQHDLKITPEYFDDIVSDIKTFEVRRNDRDFKVGDILRLMEYFPSDNSYSGEDVYATVKCIFDHPMYVKDGYVIMSIKLND
jgi:uncharacterized protein YqfB (UPF0267 family)